MIDFGDTLINLREHAFHLYNKKLKQNVSLETYNELPTLEIHRLFGLNDQEGSKMWKDSLEEIYYTDCSPFPFAVQMAKELVRDGHEVYYITSGFPVSKDPFIANTYRKQRI